MADPTSGETIVDALRERMVVRARARRSEQRLPEPVDSTMTRGSDDHRAAVRACVALLDAAAGAVPPRVVLRVARAAEEWIDSDTVSALHRALGPTRTAERREKLEVDRWREYRKLIEQAQEPGTVTAFLSGCRALAERRGDLWLLRAAWQLLHFVSKAAPVSLARFSVALGSAEAQREIARLHDDVAALRDVLHCGELLGAARAPHALALEASVRRATFECVTAAEVATACTTDELAQCAAFWFLQWAREGAPRAAIDAESWVLA